MIFHTPYSENPEDPVCEPRFRGCDSLLSGYLLNSSVSDFHRFWLISSVRSLLNLQVGKLLASQRSAPFSESPQINHKSVMSNIQDSEDRGIMIFAWWMAVLADGYSSAYFRKKPMLCVVAFTSPFCEQCADRMAFSASFIGMMMTMISISIPLLR